MLVLGAVEYCVQVADTTCYFTSAYLGNTQSSFMKDTSDQECQNYAICGDRTCVSNEEDSKAWVIVLIVLLSICCCAGCILCVCCFECCVDCAWGLATYLVGRKALLKHR